jgi:hypothetical protein
MTKIDLKQELKHLYSPSRKEFGLVEVPPMNFLMIDGRGDPNTAPEYHEAVEALYGLAYHLKFTSKKQLDIDYTVMPLEGLWWAEDMAEFSRGNKGNWQWTMMIMQPDHITAQMVDEARRALAAKKDLPALPKIRFERYDEGLSAQILYLGAYADEGPTIARMHAFIEENGYKLRGKHHEIYLGDPRRTAPEKLKTVIRQPIRKTGHVKSDK